MRAWQHELFLRAFEVLFPDRSLGRGRCAGLDAEGADERFRAVFGKVQRAGFLVGLGGELVDLIE